MNKFRVNLHQVLFDAPEILNGSEVDIATKKDLTNLSEDIESSTSEIRNTIINEYLTRVNEVETDLSRKNSNNKFNTIFNNLREYYGWNEAKIDTNSGRKIKKMNYVLAAFIYMKENNVNTLNDTVFSKIFSWLEKDKKKIVDFYNAYLEVKKQKEKQIQDSDSHRSKEGNTRRNNESLASSVEKENEATDKELKKQLNQLAKNKKIDFPWTDNEWKCSRKEKGLACASARVFQQLLEKGTLNKMLEECRHRNTPLSKEDAEARWLKCNINSKSKDIQKFHQAYLEYQNPQSEYQHLKNLMWFFCESDFEDLESVKKSLTERSKKISKKEINAKKDELYKGGDKKPKDWKQRASFEVIKDRLNSWTAIQIDKMLTLLWDFNLDWEVNSWDVWYKTWGQFVDVFRRTVATIAIEKKDFNNDVAVKNLVDYANKFWLWISSTNTVEDLYKWMTDAKNWYENTRKLQNFIKNLPVELSDVIKNWANAWQESLNNITHVLELNKEEEKRVVEAAQQKAEEIVLAWEDRLREFITDKNERGDLTQQLITQLPTILINNAKMQRDGLATGMAVPLDQVIKWLSAWFNVWIWRDGKPQFWLFLWFGRTANLSDRVQLSAAGSLWAKLLFVPIFAESLELTYDANKWSRNQSLWATGEHAISLWWNVSVTGPIVSYGVSVWYENKKQQGIEKQAANINKVLQKQAKNRVKSLQWTDKTLEWKKNALKRSLKQEFSKASESELENATNNLLSIIQWFKIDEKSTEKDFDIYAQIIADVYSEQWRNESLVWIADNKRKLSWWKVWIQFIQWYVPIPSIVAKFTRYRNARTNETELSRVARIDAQVNGTGNNKVILDSKEIWESQISQINKILERYGAKASLLYIKWKDGKPWKIQIPASVDNWMWINIRVSQKLKWTVGQISEKHIGWETFYQFPANATYRLLQETWWNQRSITLNIGSDKDDLSDIMLSDSEKMMSLLWNNELIKEKKRIELVEKDKKTVSVEYKPVFLDSLFTDEVINWLKTIDSSNWRKFSEFMRTKRDAVDKFEDMLDALNKVLWNNNKYKAIVDKLKDPSTSNEDKQLIIDRIMAFSAYANVHTKEWLDQNIKRRWDYYRKESMIGPNWKSIFDKLSVKREDILQDIQSYESIAKPNLLWATAFYHKNNTAKWLAITWIWATNVLWWVTKNLEWNDAQEAKNWFLWYTEWEMYVPWVLDKSKSPMERDNLKRVVLETIWEKELSDKNLKDLLEWKEVEFNIDKGKKKIKLDSNYVFYLMWECANESIGMELKINVTTLWEQEFDDYEEWQLYLNNSDGSNSVNIDNSNRVFGISFGWWKKKEESPQDTTTNPFEEWKDIVTPWNWTTIPWQHDVGWTGWSWNPQWNWNNGSENWWNSGNTNTTGPWTWNKWWWGGEADW